MSFANYQSWERLISFFQNQHLKMRVFSWFRKLISNADVKRKKKQLPYSPCSCQDNILSPKARIFLDCMHLRCFIWRIVFFLIHTEAFEYAEISAFFSAHFSNAFHFKVEYFQISQETNSPSIFLSCVNCKAENISARRNSEMKMSI